MQPGLSRVHAQTIISAVEPAPMPERPDLVLVGAEAPDFGLESPGGGMLRLAEYRHRDQVILVFMRAFG